MKLVQVSQFDKKNTAMSKRFDDEIMSTIRDVIVILLIYGQLETVTFSLWSS